MIMSSKSKSIPCKDLIKNCKSLQNANLLIAALLIRRLNKKKLKSVQKSEVLCCRTCLGTDQLEPLFSDSNYDKWSEDLLLVTGLEIQKDDGLPQSICSSCIQRVKNNIMFREECKRSESTLHDWGFAKPNITDIDSKNVTIKDEHNDYTDNWEELNTYIDNGEMVDNYDAYEHTEEYIEEDLEQPKLKGSVKKKVKKKKNMPPYKCHICKKCMANPSSLKTHLNWHTGQTAFICETCGKRCINRTAFLQHMKGKHGLQRTDKCNYCDYMALNKEQLKIHQRRHTGEQPYICDHCGAGFHRRANLVQHLPIHLAVKTIQCDLCPSTFKSAKFLATHKSRAHTTKNYSYLCHICQTVYKKVFNVRKHMVKMHGIPREQQGDVIRIRVRSFGDAVYNTCDPTPIIRAD